MDVIPAANFGKFKLRFQIEHQLVFHNQSESSATLNFFLISMILFSTCSRYSLHSEASARPSSNFSSPCSNDNFPDSNSSVIFSSFSYDFAKSNFLDILMKLSVRYFLFGVFPFF